jgi:hypothetical protein
MNSQTPNKNSQLRVVLLRGEVQQVKPDYRGLRVRSGRAWVTMNGRDLVLKRGEEIALEKRRDAVVVSSLGQVPVVVELLGEAPCHATIDPRLVTSTLR